MNPLGIDGIRSRIQEIQGRIQRMTGDDEAFQPPKPPTTPPSLQGPLTFPGRPANPAFPAGSLAPMDPSALGLQSLGGASPAAADLRTMAAEAARRHGIDPRLFHALVNQESGFNPRAVSHAGARGLTQLMPGTARMLGVTDPHDPQQNLDGGARYLAQMLKEFNGDVKLALAAYNAGPGAVRRHGGIPPFRETQNYVKTITAAWARAGE